MKKHVLVSIVAIGLVIGFVAASQLWPRPSRAENLARLFSEFCLPHFHGEDVTAAAEANLISDKRSQTSDRWIDNRSASYLSLSSHRCSISTYPPFALSRQEAEELLGLVETIVLREFPDLPFDPKATMGPNSISKGWMQGASLSPDRWGVFFTASPDWGDRAGSSLFLASPRHKIDLGTN